MSEIMPPRAAPSPGLPADDAQAEELLRQRGLLESSYAIAWAILRLARAVRELKTLP
jgi:hypothetical protein